MFDYIFFDPADAHLIIDALIRLAEAGNVDNAELINGLHESWRAASAEGSYDVARVVSTLELEAFYNELIPVDLSGWYM